MIALGSRWIRVALCSTVLLIAVPMAYLGFLEAIVLHPGLRLSSGWEDNDFNTGHQDSYTTPNWSITSNRQVNASISNGDGMLEISAIGNLSAGTIVSAQRQRGLSFNLTVYSYLRVSIKTSSIDVAARIVVWTNATYFRDVLVKTYNDDEWHLELVDLSFFDLHEEVYMIELGLMQLYPSNSSERVSYKQLSFSQLEL